MFIGSFAEKACEPILQAAQAGQLRPSRRSRSREPRCVRAERREGAAYFPPRPAQLRHSAIRCSWVETPAPPTHAVPVTCQRATQSALGTCRLKIQTAARQAPGDLRRPGRSLGFVRAMEHRIVGPGPYRATKLVSQCAGPWAKPLVPVSPRTALVSAGPEGPRCGGGRWARTHWGCGLQVSRANGALSIAIRGWVQVRPQDHGGVLGLKRRSEALADPLLLCPLEPDAGVRPKMLPAT
jgi:hypothetical protein